jgi:hypothetical protein
LGIWQSRRPHIRMALRVDAVKIIVYDKLSLAKDACLWEGEFTLKKEPDLPHETLLATIKAVNAFF